ncbi:hypothetical protein A3D14_02340 [Candidatus Saccharibacteria bacterium RIFCSPHIGHO2_02_FULL_47_12]|nr:MAG: hypothetical protein A3D14_02340 [Candidatus Saccharibacteria bacterium RIFCSPHIGHO2_02_FULL_47_12]
MEQPQARLAEGKTKIIWDLPGTDEVIIESKDDITAGDGERRDVIEGKAALATQTTGNCFRLLERAGIPTHFVTQEGDRTFRAKRVDMIPIELVARRVAFGSYLKRDPGTQPRTKFENVKFEMFAKDDPNHDPILDYDFETGVVRRYKASAPISADTLVDEVPISESPFAISPEQQDVLAGLTIDTFEVLEAAWADHEVTLVDLKIECGVTADGQIVVADVIDNDSWRIWPGGDPEQMVDKQLYRDGQPLDYVADRYAWVAEATNHFNPTTT